MILSWAFVILFIAMLICKNEKINTVLGEGREREKKITQKHYNKFTEG